jgi:hypothetical protein
MEHEKKYTAKEAAVAVLKKAEEILKSSSLMKAATGPTLGSVIGFPGSPPTAPIAKSDNKVQAQPAPNKNPAEIAENSNPAPGASPQNTEKYGAEMKGHLKLAKFIGRMEAKRGAKTAPAAIPAPAAASVKPTV